MSAMGELRPDPGGGRMQRQPATAEGEPDRRAPGPLRVLIIDDSAVVGAHLRTLLADIGGLEVVGHVGDV
jgi:hypothetical protein